MKKLNKFQMFFARFRRKHNRLANFLSLLFLWLTLSFIILAVLSGTFVGVLSVVMALVCFALRLVFKRSSDWEKNLLEYKFEKVEKAMKEVYPYLTKASLLGICDTILDWIINSKTEQIQQRFMRWMSGLHEVLITIKKRKEAEKELKNLPDYLVITKICKQILGLKIDFEDEKEKC